MKKKESEGNKRSVPTWLIVVIVVTVFYALTQPDQNEDISQKSSPSANSQSSTDGADKFSIKGLTPADVYLNFTGKGFSKKMSAQKNSKYLWWHLTDNRDSNRSYSVDLYGVGGLSVVSIRGVILNYSNQTIDGMAKEFLGYLASTPYKNSDPIKARQWVFDNINKNKAKTNIGGVNFEIFFNGKKNRTLLIQVGEGWSNF